MTTRRILALLTLAAAGLSGCFDDLRPNVLNLRIDGPAGEPVDLLLTKNFLAGINEQGVTEVTVLSSDTVRMRLPVDTAMNIAVEQRFFMQAVPVGADSLPVSLRIDIDGRGRFNQSGNLLADPPFRWVFMFNAPTTLVIELI